MASGCHKADAPETIPARSDIQSITAPSRGISEPSEQTSLRLASNLRADDVFADQAEELNVQFTYRNGREGLKFTIIEGMGGGVATCDFDGDDQVEIFFVGGGSLVGSPIVVSGHSGGYFRKTTTGSYVNVTIPAGLSQSSTYTLGCSVTDYDCDGNPDLLVTGYPQSYLFHNSGDGTFEEVTGISQLELSGLHAASVWGDFDGDGLPDLFVTGYVKYDLREDRICGAKFGTNQDICGVWKYAAASDQLFRNRGNGTFEEITEFSKLRRDGKGLGAVAADINADGKLDLYVANDGTPNFLYFGDGHGRFTESGLITGTALDENGAPQGSMGVDFGDYNGDGFGDLFVTNYELEDNILYRNRGDASFDVVTSQMNLHNIGRPYVGFGTGWVDWNSDGWLDLFVLNGHVMYHSGKNMYEQPQFLFQNVDGQRFEDASGNGGPYFRASRVARGAAVADLNNDGAPDLISVHHNTPASLLINRRPPSQWVRVCLHGTTSESFGTGAVVTSLFAGRILTRHVRGGAGYFSHFDRRILFPIDDNGKAECIVQWLDGKRERFGNLEISRTNPLIEGRGERL